MEDLEGASLPELFERGAGLASLLSGGGSASLQELASTAAGLKRALVMIDALGLFSPNEDKEDIVTGDLKYLLTQAYLSELLAQLGSAGGDTARRRAALREAAAHAAGYLELARQYDLLGPEAAAMASNLGAGGQPEEPVSATTLRERKIAKFKRDREIKRRLEELQARSEGRAGCASAAAAEERGGDAEEEAREAWLLRLDAAALQAADRLPLLRQELELLELHAAAERSDPDKRPGPSPEAEAQRAAAADALRSAAGALRAGSARSEREALRQAVFRPAHVLPTLSVEQQGEVEVAAMLAAQRAQQEGEAAARAARQAERRGAAREAAEERELCKAREWDEFKDDNPAGWGNSKLRPCG